MAMERRLDLLRSNAERLGVYVGKKNFRPQTFDHRCTGIEGEGGANNPVPGTDSLGHQRQEKRICSGTTGHRVASAGVFRNLLFEAFDLGPANKVLLRHDSSNGFADFRFDLCVLCSEIKERRRSRCHKDCPRPNRVGYRATEGAAHFMACSLANREGGAKSTQSPGCPQFCNSIGIVPQRFFQHCVIVLADGRGHGGLRGVLIDHLQRERQHVGAVFLM